MNEVDKLKKLKIIPFNLLKKAVKIDLARQRKKLAMEEFSVILRKILK